MTGKKSFTAQQNPAMAFISTPAPETAKPMKPLYVKEEAHAKTTDAPAGYKVNPLYVETKSRRLQLLVQPSLYEAIKAKAATEGISVNELVHTILEAAIKEG